MKKILFLAAVLFISVANAQQVADYKYITIPEKFSDFEKGQYNLENYLRLLLGQKEYEVISETRTYWPEEARLNPCLVIHSDITKISSAFKNKLNLKFTDCNQTVVGEYEGESTIKEFSEGYKDALNSAVSLIKTQNAVMPYRETENKQVTIVQTTQTQNPGTELFKKHSQQPKQTVFNSQVTEQTIHNSKMDMNPYEYNGQTVYLSMLPDGEFTVLDASKTKILALYTPSTKPGIYHVKVNSGNTSYMTIGYVEDDAISYEYSADSKTWTLIKLTKK